MTFSLGFLGMLANWCALGVQVDSILSNIIVANDKNIYMLNFINISDIYISKMWMK